MDVVWEGVQRAHGGLLLRRVPARACRQAWWGGSKHAGMVGKPKAHRHAERSCRRRLRRRRWARRAAVVVELSSLPTLVPRPPAHCAQVARRLGAGGRNTSEGDDDSLTMTARAPGQRARRPRACSSPPHGMASPMHSSAPFQNDAAGHQKHRQRRQVGRGRNGLGPGAENDGRQGTEGVGEEGGSKDGAPKGGLGGGDGARGRTMLCSSVSQGAAAGGRGDGASGGVGGAEGGTADGVGGLTEGCCPGGLLN